MSLGRGLCLGSAPGRGEAASAKEGLLTVELQSLEVGPWVVVCGWGLGPAQLEGVSEGVSECGGGALGGGVGAELVFCMAGGRL